MTQNQNMREVLPPRLEVIEALAAQIPKSRWGVWRRQSAEGEGKDKKAPGRIRGRGRFEPISHNNPDLWGNIDTVLGEYSRAGGVADGVGFLVASNPKGNEEVRFSSGVVGLDFDGITNDDGELVDALSADVRTVLKILQDNRIYIERSQSGHGLHALWIGRKPEGLVKEKWNSYGFSGELYDGYGAGRFLITTGVPWLGSEPVLVGQSAGFTQNISEYLGLFPEQDGGGTGSADLGLGAGEDWPSVSDDELGKLLRVNNKRGVITRLMVGDTAGHDGDSEARGALIAHIAYYTRDISQIDRIIRTTGLMKPKLDEMRSGDKFSVWEIKRVLAGIDAKGGGGSYWRDRAAKVAGVAIEKASRRGLIEKSNDFLVGGLTGLTGPKGNLLQNQYTLAELLHRDRRLLGAVYYDEYSKMPIKTAAFDVISSGGEVGEFGEILTDRDQRRTEDWLCREWGVTLKPGEIRRIILAWADRTSIDIVVDRLNKYADEWDGKPRLETWLRDYCGADAGEDEELAYYYSRVGVMFMLQVVARAYQPGAKCDCMIVFESKQGQRKSSAARVLGEALSPRAFMEGFSLDRMDKDTKISLRGRAIIEFGELDGLSKHDASTLKNFVSLQADSYRDIYGSANTDWPRTSVFIGTTNETSYLRDPSGNRRWWPVVVRTIRIDVLRQDAGQLWGEAVQLYRHGVRWWIEEFGDEDARIRSIQQRETLKRMMPDTWAEMIEEFGERLAFGQVPHPRTPDLMATLDMSFKLVELMHMVFGEDGRAVRRSVPEEVRFRSALTRAGWQHNGSDSHGKWALSAGAKAEVLRRTR